MLDVSELVTRSMEAGEEIELWGLREGCGIRKDRKAERPRSVLPQARAPASGSRGSVFIFYWRLPQSTRCEENTAFLSDRPTNFRQKNLPALIPQ